MLIAVPSKGRPGKVKTLKVIPSATVFVPDNEVPAYREFYPAAKIQGVPTSVSGITKTRNWILENADDDSVVMIDDDVKVCGWVELQEEKSRHKKLEEKVWLAECKKLFEITRQMKYRLWGIATQSAPRSVYPYKPFLFRSYVTASFCGICNESGIRFDESFRVKEDYELNLRCVKEDGGVVAARYLYWENSHWSDDGGCKDYRTQKMEKECIDRLKAKYPSMVKRIVRGGSEFSIELVF
jgi:hypothetical protein